MESDSDSASSSSSYSTTRPSPPPPPPQPKPVLKLKLNFAKHAVSSPVPAAVSTPKLKLKRPLTLVDEAGSSSPAPHTSVQKISIKVPKSKDVKGPAKGKGHAKVKVKTPKVVSNQKTATSMPVDRLQTPVADVQDEITVVATAESTPMTGTPDGGPIDIDFEHDEVSTPSLDATSVNFPYQRKYWARLKKPLGEWVRKIVAEIRRRDDYGLFLDPVDIDEYPDYLDRIGGPDNAMDTSTMLSKMDNRQYKSLEDFEMDLHKLVKAAQTFNPENSVPYNAAAKVLQHAQKHIDRSRALVRTPSPTPEPGPEEPTPRGSARAESVTSVHDSPRGVTVEPPAPTIEKIEVPPKVLIPDEMLAYPPGSLQALAVGWHATGGKVVRSKRQTRARERWVGKWRDWALDGSRDLAEQDDLGPWFREIQEVHASRVGVHVIDWAEIAKQGGWEAYAPEPLGGQTGQPPLPGAAVVPPPPLPKRKLEHTDFGAYPMLADKPFLQGAGRSFFTAANATMTEEQLLPSVAKQLRPEPIADPKRYSVYDNAAAPDAKAWLAQVCTGGPRGEAYMRSVEGFVRGAVAGRQSSTGSSGTSGMSLEKYVKTQWRGGFIDSGPRALVNDTIAALNTNASSVHGVELEPIKANLPALIALRKIAYPPPGLEIAALLRSPSDFDHVGVGAKVGIPDGLAHVAQELTRERTLKKKKSGKVEKGEDGKSVLVPEPEDEELRKIRLEILGLCKFYPLASLRKMSKEEAERLLPPNVRALMSR